MSLQLFRHLNIHEEGRLKNISINRFIILFAPKCHFLFFLTFIFELDIVEESLIDLELVVTCDTVLLFCNMTSETFKKVCY